MIRKHEMLVSLTVTGDSTLDLSIIFIFFEKFTSTAQRKEKIYLYCILQGILYTFNYSNKMYNLIFLNILLITIYLSKSIFNSIIVIGCHVNVPYHKRNPIGLKYLLDHA